MAHNLALGAHGEDLAARYLTDAGMEIVDRNWRSRYGEVDLIAAEGDWLVFVEVKTRRGLGFGSPAEAVTFSKQRRIRLLAVEWLRDSGRHWSRVRFDVVAIMVNRAGEPQIEHVRDAF
ncbi:YraN family protein [Rhodococcus sp. NPDC019627]|jgi:putative endonuclease|uniref:YraN family protein n=1 Tax=Rhodococcus TaxID=1827 RepID=UPI00202DE16C|nr:MULTISPECIES: YraN family protein [Rhodococcus]MDV7352442.1 YraN family protein [Rhodococcus oxybenzonivorans]